MTGTSFRVLDTEPSVGMVFMSTIGATSEPPFNFFLDLMKQPAPPIRNRMTVPTLAPNMITIVSPSISSAPTVASETSGSSYPSMMTLPLLPSNAGIDDGSLL